MTTKAFTIIAVRLIGLLALFKAALGIPVLLWALLQFARGMKAGAPSVGRMSVLNLAFSIVLPLALGIACLARSKPIAALIAKGTDKTPAETESKG